MLLVKCKFLCQTYFFFFKVPPKKIYKEMVYSGNLLLFNIWTLNVTFMRGGVTSNSLVSLKVKVSNYHPLHPLMNIYRGSFSILILAEGFKHALVNLEWSIIFLVWWYEVWVHILCVYRSLCAWLPLIESIIFNLQSHKHQICLHGHF